MRSFERMLTCLAASTSWTRRNLLERFNFLGGKDGRLEYVVLLINGAEKPTLRASQQRR
jgi:hypothetical protein